MQTKFDRINQDDKELLEEFLDNLTEGDIIKIAKSMLYDQSDIKKICKAFENFQESY